MKKQKNRVTINILTFSLFAFLLGCGETSGSSSSKSGEGVGFSSSKSASPGEMARLQNQNAPDQADATSDQSNGGNGDDITPLYKALSSNDLKVRKKAERQLRNAVNYNPDLLEELKKIENENLSPGSWYLTKVIIQEAEEERARAEEEDRKRQLAEMNETE